MKIKLSGSLSIKDTARSSAVAEETFSKLVTSVLKLETDLLGVEILSSEQGWSVHHVACSRTVGAGLEPVWLSGLWRWVLQGRLELTALVGTGTAATAVMSPGLRPPVPGGESDADIGLAVLGDEDWTKGSLVRISGEEAGAGIRPLSEGSGEGGLQEPERSLLYLLSCSCCY